MSDFSAAHISPPWVAFPDIQRAELSRYLKQGATEAWFDQQRDYLDRWHAAAEWREAVAFYFESDSAFDVEADAQESEEYLSEKEN